MFKFFEERRKRKEELRNQELEAFYLKKREEEAKKQKELEEAFAAIAKKNDEDLKNSDSPWIKVESAEIDPIHGVKFKLDWNTAFIEFLKQNGFTGTSEEHLVQKYLGALYGQIYSDGANKDLEKFKE